MMSSPQEPRTIDDKPNGCRDESIVGALGAVQRRVEPMQNVIVFPGSIRVFWEYYCSTAVPSFAGY